MLDSWLVSSFSITTETRKPMMNYDGAHSLSISHRKHSLSNCFLDLLIFVTKTTNRLWARQCFFSPFSFSLLLIIIQFVSVLLF